MISKSLTITVKELTIILTQEEAELLADLTQNSQHPDELLSMRDLREAIYTACISVR